MIQPAGKEPWPLTGARGGDIDFAGDDAVNDDSGDNCFVTPGS